MNYLDLVLLIALGGFVLYGLWFGFIHMVGTVAGLVFGALVAGWYYPVGSSWLQHYLGNANVANFIAFFVIFVLVTRLVGLVFWIVEKAFGFISVIPFLMTFNRLLGAALGLVEGALVLGLAVWFAARFPFSVPFVDAMQSSAFAHILNFAGGLLAVLMPTALKSVQSIF